MKFFFLTISVIILNAAISCSSDSSGNVKPLKEPTDGIPKTENNKKIGFKEEPMDEETIKELVGFKNKIEEYLSWSDSEGKHLVFTNETGVYYSNLREEGELFDQNAEVSCYHYIQKTGQENFEKSWKIFDYSRDCPVDAGAAFKNNTLQKTDLNENGIAEVWVMYYIFCKGDVSPDELKIIMYEGKKKYKMTGETRIEVGEGEFYGGNILSEGNFKEQPEFLKFAKSLWKNNC